MKALGITFVVVAILIGLIPAFNNCTYDGKSLTVTSPAMAMGAKTGGMGDKAKPMQDKTMGMLGKTTTAAATKKVDMKCFWTSRAALGVAFPLGLVGILLSFSLRKETQRALSIMGGSLSVVAFLLPTALIGVCAMDSSCKLVTRPALMLLGIVGLGLAVTGGVLSQRREEDVM